ncbi:MULTISPECIES: TIGR01548 family HAD-type hydrolase [Pseudanabaena]|uniref:HAD superfamily (Subfamily IA) hydrolase, TIGR01548 n=2 Tax=Pseudanabaena TaxID=1152 RepID=L8MZP0_9CYAN|nr:MULTISPECIES: TIGR01548 family HAD-type hydrolase [Pseudanabaena]ELS31960.1 HAD superfamily (subfamily IA) hydrolase, TIGR01548 [Pseudanabaena biceps PCC 7429]MDG3495788.1 TIGR01548 family HAD-type hydrolase [Pseudanabaena catenata USMAC16]
MIETSKVDLKLSNKSIFVFDIDGVIRDVSGSYRRALADTVEHFIKNLTNLDYRPTPEEIDDLKAEGIWNNDWEASQEMITRYLHRLGKKIPIAYEEIVNFFQSRYRGLNSDWSDGYIATEPLIATAAYFQELTIAGIGWGFFSGATRASASYVLQRLAIDLPILIAMEDAAGKPDPTGLLLATKQIEQKQGGLAKTIVYVGDTVADMLTVVKARDFDPSYQYVAVGVIPPHVSQDLRDRYASLLKENGADLVLNSVLELTPQLNLLQSSVS